MPFATGPGAAEVWVARLRARLENTPHEARVVAAAASHLTHADVATRVRAVRFFTFAPAHAKAMRAEVLLGEHAALFVGIELPHGVFSVQKTLDNLIWWLCRDEIATNDDFRAFARAFALDPSRSRRVLVEALADYDRDRVVAEAKAMAPATRATAVAVEVVKEARNVPTTTIAGASDDDIADLYDPNSGEMP